LGADYGWEKFFTAFRFAVISEESVQARLGGVMQEVSHLQRDSFPDSDEGLWKKFHDLMDATSHVAATMDEGTIAATTSRMGKQEARKYLQEAFDIFDELAKAYGHDL
jgi:hypothetical protein